MTTKVLAVAVVVLGLSVVACGADQLLQNGLTGVWVLTLKGTQCTAGDCVPTPYCAVATVCVTQEGSNLRMRVCQPVNGDSKKTPLPNWSFVNGFADCGSIWLGTDIFTKGEPVQFIMTGKVRTFGRLICGDFVELSQDVAKVLNVHGLRGTFTALKISSQTMM